MDAGYRFTSDGGATFPYRGRGIFVPTLRQAMEALPHAVFNIDMKEGEPAAVPLGRLVRPNTPPHPPEHTRASRRSNLLARGRCPD